MFSARAATGAQNHCFIHYRTIKMQKSRKTLFSFIVNLNSLRNKNNFDE